MTQERSISRIHNYLQQISDIGPANSIDELSMALGKQKSRKKKKIEKTKRQKGRQTWSLNFSKQTSQTRMPYSLQQSHCSQGFKQLTPQQNQVSRWVKAEVFGIVLFSWWVRLDIDILTSSLDSLIWLPICFDQLFSIKCRHKLGINSDWPTYNHRHKKKNICQN